MNNFKIVTAQQAKATCIYMNIKGKIYTDNFGQLVEQNM